MANVDKPFGFRVLRTLSGKAPNMNPYSLAAANTRIRIGDVLVATSDGVVDHASTSANPFEGAAPIIGIAAENKDASAGGTIYVYDNPDLVMIAQCDNGTVMAETNRNLNYDIISTATTTENISIMEIDASSGVSTAATPLKAIRLYPALDNAWGEFAILEVTWAQHQFKSSGGSLGV